MTRKKEKTLSRRELIEKGRKKLDSVRFNFIDDKYTNDQDRGDILIAIARSNTVPIYLDSNKDSICIWCLKPILAKTIYVKCLSGAKRVLFKWHKFHYDCYTEFIEKFRKIILTSQEHQDLFYPSQHKRKKVHINKEYSPEERERVLHSFTKTNKKRVRLNINKNTKPCIWCSKYIIYGTYQYYSAICIPEPTSIYRFKTYKYGFHPECYKEFCIKYKQPLPDDIEKVIDAQTRQSKGGDFIPT